MIVSEDGSESSTRFLKKSTDHVQVEGLTHFPAVRDGSKFPSVVAALTRKRIPTKIAVKLELADIEKSTERPDESEKSEFGVFPEDSANLSMRPAHQVIPGT